jgi:hypothetical protein
MDAPRARLEGATTQLEIVVLAHRQNRPTGRDDGGDGRDAVVGTRGEIDQDAIDVVERCGQGVR